LVRGEADAAAIGKAQLQWRGARLMFAMSRGVEPGFRRLRGSEPDDVTDLMHGQDRGMSALFLDIKNSTVFTGDHHPAEVMLTLNQLITELTAELRRHEGTVNAYRGNGFLALCG
jgi:class 3 adenylate cyclase